MAWNDPNELTWAEGSPLTAEDMNTYVKNNLLALRALNVEQTMHLLNAAIASNNTSFVDADPNNLKVQIDISSDKLLCIASFVGSKATNGSAYFDLIVNQDGGSTNVRAGDATNGLVQISSTASQREIILVGFWTGLQPGTKIVKIQMRSSNSNNANIFNDMAVLMTALEV